MDLHGKIALVTGGTRGIGAAAALALAQAGADVAVVGRYEDDESRAARDRIAATGRRALLVLADVAKPADATRCVEQTVEALGGLDVLVHSAGGNVPGGILDVTPEAWYNAFDVHVHAVFHMARAAIPVMRKRGGGAMVLVSSVAGIRGIPMNIAYQVVKGTIPQFARALARMHADDNIRVNCVAPGIVLTRFHAGITDAQRKHNLDNRIPLHREGTCEEIASAVVQLVTNDYVTGETFTVDGGLTMRIA